MTNTDKELAKAWADFYVGCSAPDFYAAARYILVTMADNEPSWRDQAMRAQSINSSMDCRFAGRWAEMSGSHCPADRPCSRCTAEREIEKLQAEVDRLSARPVMPDGIQAGCGVHPFVSAVCSHGTKSCVVDHGAIGRLTKERDEALTEANRVSAWANALAQKKQAWPAAEDAEMDAAVTYLRMFDATVGVCTHESAMHQCLLLLAARVKELKARG